MSEKSKNIESKSKDQTDFEKYTTSGTSEIDSLDYWKK